MGYIIGTIQNINSAFINTTMFMFFLVLSVLLIHSCAGTSYYPYAGEEPRGPLKSTFTSDDGVTVNVIPSFWPGQPSNLDNYVTPFYIEIVNNSGTTLYVNYEDIVLFDEFKTQYNPLHPQAVAEIISTSDRSNSRSYGTISIGIGGGYYGGYYGNPFGHIGFYPTWYYPATSYLQPVNTKDIFTEALLPGPVYPGATLLGFLYFKQVPRGVTNVTLDVGYRVEHKPERHVLSFPFSVGFQKY